MRRASACKRVYIGFNGGGSDTSRVPHGEPYAGKLHVRFDEGAGVPDNEGRPALLYTLIVGFGCWGCAKLWYNVRHEAVAQLQDQPVLPSVRPYRRA